MDLWHRRRHRARTDLLWLCNHVLGFPDVSQRVHGPILDVLQKFDGAHEKHKTEEDFAAALQGKVLWEPRTQFERLRPLNNRRKSLILFPRKHLKSTIATEAHSIQWLINYPNIRILLTTATEDLAIAFMKSIRSQFTSNEKFRYLFPELCPKAMADGKVPELGNLGEFTIPGRDITNKRLGPGGKDPSMKMSTVGSSITGYHGDVFKCDDMVEKENSKTNTGIEDVIYHFGTMDPLLDSYTNPDGGEPLVGWRDVIGTPWDFSDLYQVIQNGEEQLVEEERQFNIVKRSAAPNWNSGTTPETKGPYLWPERLGYKQLRAIENDPTAGPQILSSQYLMNPIVAGKGLIDNIKSIIWVPRKEMNEILPKLSLYAALDLAGMDSEARGGDNDYTCLSVGGFNTDGRLYVPYILYGRPTTDEVIEWVFQVFQRFPRLIKLKVEKEAHARVLLPFLKKEMARRQQFPNISAEPRSNQQSKKDKIKGLRPWFVSGDIRFAADLPCRTALETEIKGFPKFRHDDILDTLTDLMFEGKDVNLAVMGREKSIQDEIPLKEGLIIIPTVPQRKINFDEIFESLYSGNEKYNRFTGHSQ